MAYQNLLWEKKEGIGFITFNRPDRLNALNFRTMDDLDAVLTEAANDSAVRVLIVTGAGEKAFVAGADINELAALTAARRPCDGLARPKRVSQAGNAGETVDRRHQWICAGRRLRTGAGVLDPFGEPHCQAGSAGSKARHHSRLWRNTTVVAAVRQRDCP